MWGEAKADELLAAAAETHALWAGELDYSDLAKDIAIEARLVLALTDEIKELDERIAVMLDRADPAGIIRSAPGVGAVTGAAILGRLGDRDGSHHSPPPGRSPVSSPRSTPPARPVGMVVRRSGVMLSCARPCSSRPITPGGSTRPWRRAITGS
jgi:hypothetical protein